MFGTSTDTVAQDIRVVEFDLPLDEPQEESPSLIFIPEDCTKIFHLFGYAISQRLRFPKIRLMAADGQVVVLRRAGARSKYTGQIQILDGGRYPNNSYFGRINLDGVLCPSSEMTGAVNDLLARLAADPAKVAFEYGKLTGRCCFCDLPLIDPRSTAHGYGPVCAENYGLPWNIRRDGRGWQMGQEEKKTWAS